MIQKNMKICMCDHKPEISLWLNSHVIWITVECSMKFPCENECSTHANMNMVDYVCFNLISVRYLMFDFYQQ